MLYIFQQSCLHLWWNLIFSQCGPLWQLQLVFVLLTRHLNDTTCSQSQYSRSYKLLLLARKHTSMTVKTNEACLPQDLSPIFLYFFQDVSNFPHFLKNSCTSIPPNISWSPAHLIASILTRAPCQYRTTLMLICYLDLAKYIYVCIWLISHYFLLNGAWDSLLFDCWFSWNW